MKTTTLKKSFAALVILIFAATMTVASAAPRKTATDLKSLVRSTVTYPKFAKENQLSGFVVVSFNIDETGKINISELNTNSIYFQLYVENKLKEIQIQDPEAYSGKTYYYRFDFELIN